jgi:hypothetical protein
MTVAFAIRDTVVSFCLAMPPTTASRYTIPERSGARLLCAGASKKLPVARTKFLFKPDELERLSYEP